jgi:hypothetical protein
LEAVFRKTVLVPGQGAKNVATQERTREYHDTSAQESFFFSGNPLLETA